MVVSEGIMNLYTDLVDHNFFSPKVWKIVVLDKLLPVYSTPLKVYKNEEVYSSSKDFLATWVKPHISYSSLTIYPIGTKITFLNDNSGS